MKQVSIIACLLLAGCAPEQRATVAIRDATIVDVTDGSLLAGQTVLVAGNRIVAVGPSAELQVAAGADVIDAENGFLIPGLWDMHVHSLQPMTADSTSGSVINADWHFPLFLAFGVTGVRSMNDGTADATLALTNSIKRRLATGELRGPRLIASGPSIDGDPPVALNPLVVRTPADARSVVDQLTQQGADFLKVYDNLPREAYFALMDQARRRRIPVDGHVPFRVLPREAADAGQRTFEHVGAMGLGCSRDLEGAREAYERDLSDGVATPMVMFRHERRLYDTRDPAACRATIEAYRRNGTAEMADIVAYHHVVHAQEIVSDTARMRLVPEPLRRRWESLVSSDYATEVQATLRPLVRLQAENARLLSDAGITLLAGTDVGLPTLVPGLSLHEELTLLVGAGVPLLHALQAATLNPARVLGLADSLGTIEAGKLADLVLLDANPLIDIGNTRRIRAVVADGRLYRRADLDRLLTAAQSSGEPVSSRQ